MDVATAAAMAQLTQQVESLQGRLAALTLQQAAATAEPDGGVNTPHVQPGRLAIDARQLNKPDVFTAEDKKCREWEIVFRSYATLANPALEFLLRKAEALKTPIVMTTLVEAERRAGCAVKRLTRW